MIAGIGAALTRPHMSRPVEDEHSPQLPRVALRRLLTGATAPGSPSGQKEPGIHCPIPGAVQAGDTIGTQARIDEQGEGQSHFVADGGRLPGRAIPDGDDPRSETCQLIMDVAQLRELLAAEDSPEVADEKQQRRTGTQDRR